MAKDRSQRMWIGVILIIIGAMILFDNLDLIEFGDIIGNWWPLVVIIVGIFKLNEPNKNSAIFLLIAGFVLLMMTLDIIEFHDILQFWPVALILIGLSLLFKSRSSRRNEITEDDFSLSAIFGEIDHEIVSNNLQGGEVTVIFGEAEIDMSGVTVSEKGATLELSAIFGEITIRVPKDVRVLVMGSPFLGGIENRTSSNVADTQPAIRCHCSAILGSVEIKD